MENQTKEIVDEIVKKYRNMENKNKEIIEEIVKKPKETHVEYCRRYYKENREKHLAYINTKVDCAICGKQFARCRIQRHKKSNLHKLNEKLKDLETELNKSKKN